MNRNNSDADRPDPCDHCGARIHKLAPGETFECPECGEEWAADEQGIWHADDLEA